MHQACRKLGNSMFQEYSSRLHQSQVPNCKQTLDFQGHIAGGPAQTAQTAQYSFGIEIKTMVHCLTRSDLQTMLIVTCIGNPKPFSWL